MLTERIHDALTACGHSGTFRRITYIGKPEKRKLESSREKPSTVMAWDDQLDFVDNRQRRDCSHDMMMAGCEEHAGTSFFQERGDWSWNLMLHFDNQVSLELFEDRLMSNPIFIPRTNGGQQVIVKLRERLQDQPVKKQASHGTRVTYRFVAEVSPL